MVRPLGVARTQVRGRPSTKRLSSCTKPALTRTFKWEASSHPAVELLGLPVHTSRVDGVYTGRVRRIQIHIDEALDDAAEAEAARRGLSKAALIRASLARELVVDQRPATDPWKALTGWLDDGPVEDLDAVVYDRDR